MELFQYIFQMWANIIQPLWPKGKNAPVPPSANGAGQVAQVAAARKIFFWDHFKAWLPSTDLYFHWTHFIVENIIWVSKQKILRTY